MQTFVAPSRARFFAARRFRCPVIGGPSKTGIDKHGFLPTAHSLGFCRMVLWTQSGPSSRRAL